MSQFCLLRVAVSLALVTTFLGACDDEELPPPGDRFGTADAVHLVMEESAAPRGLDPVTGSSGPAAVEQLTDDGERARTLRSIGVGAGYLQEMAAEEGERSRSLGESLLSWSLILPDENAARQALDHLRTVPETTRADVRVNDARGFGRGAFRQFSRVDGAHSAAYIWQVHNAIVGLEARSQAGKPDAHKLLAIGNRLVRKNDRVDRSGEDLSLPNPPASAPVLLEEDFEGDREWDVDHGTDAAGIRLTRYAAGGFLIGNDGLGSRWHETSELRGDELESIGDTIVDVIAERIQGRDGARWGPMCRVVGTAGFYLFVVGADGYAGIYSSLGPSEPFEVMAEVDRSEVVREAVRKGRHRLHATCTGDPIATLSLDVNGVRVLQAYDDDPRPRGSVGLWVESPNDPVAVLYDDLFVAGSER